ncbi:MAG: hypothetical protein ACPGUD_06475 [Parashewanella sp.]
MSEEMDMPCPCPNCGNIVELNDMCNHPEDFKTMVCESCYDTLVDEMNSGETTDYFGNVLSYKYQPDDGLVTFFVNGKEQTQWGVEDDPESNFIEFVKTWNAAQETTLRSIKLNKDEVAEFVLKSSSGSCSYSSEDVDLVKDELKHVETYLSNAATSIEQKDSIY